MVVKIQIQQATQDQNIPDRDQLRRFAKKTLLGKMESAELTIRLVDETEMTQLNTTYRHKNGPTNVLSFPFEVPKEVAMDTPLLGDIVICAGIVTQEALAQNKSSDAHWAHMVVHGILHLLGYDHEINTEALVMEAEEIRILTSLGFANPYEIKGNPHE